MRDLQDQNIDTDINADESGSNHSCNTTRSSREVNIRAHPDCAVAIMR